MGRARSPPGQPTRKLEILGVPAKISKKGAAYHKPFPPSPQNRLPRRTANKSVRLRDHDFRSMLYAPTPTAPSSVGAACRFFRGAFGRPLRTFL